MAIGQAFIPLVECIRPRTLLHPCGCGLVHTLLRGHPPDYLA